MIRVLHVLDASTSAAVRDRVRVLLDRLPTDRYSQSVVCLDGRTARRAKQEFAGRGRVAIARARLFGGLLPDKVDRETVLHACGARALMACRVNGSGPVVFNADTPSVDAQRRWLRSLWNDCVTCVAGSQTARREWVAAGMRPERVVVVRGAVDFGEINAARRANVRGGLLKENEGPVVLAADHGAGEGVVDAAWAVAILKHLLPAARLLIPFGTQQADRARRLLIAANLGNAWLDMPSGWHWPQCVAAADVFVEASRNAPSTEPLAWAMASGVPVIGAAVRATAELIADRHNGVLLREPTPRNLAAAMLRVLEDADLRRHLTQTARGQAYEVFSARAFVDNMAAVFENAAHQRDPAAGVRDTAMVA